MPHVRRYRRSMTHTISTSTGNRSIPTKQNVCTYDLNFIVCHRLRVISRFFSAGVARSTPVFNYAATDLSLIAFLKRGFPQPDHDLPSLTTQLACQFDAARPDSFGREANCAAKRLNRVDFLRRFLLGARLFGYSHPAIGLELQIPMICRNAGS